MPTCPSQRGEWVLATSSRKSSTEGFEHTGARSKSEEVQMSSFSFGLTNWVSWCIPTISPTRYGKSVVGGAFYMKQGFCSIATARIPWMFRLLSNLSPGLSNPPIDRATIVSPALRSRCLTICLQRPMPTLVGVPLHLRVRATNLPY